MAKKHKHKKNPELAGERTIKRFRVCREGQTIDGRNISQQEIIDMAETYNPVEYTARINCEHISGWYEGIDGKHSSLGDVIAVDCQVDTFQRNGQDVQLMSLYATLSALPKLVEANKKGKKLFTSIEFYRKFADTGRAYIVGLAVTDSPASRGTEPLKFSTQKNDTIFTELQELTLMGKNNQANTKTDNNGADNLTTATTQANTENLTTPPTDETKEGGFFTGLKNMFSKNGTGKGMTKDEQDQLLETFGCVSKELSDVKESYAELSESHNELLQKFEALESKLSQQCNFTIIRESAGSGQQLAEC